MDNYAPNPDRSTGDRTQEKSAAVKIPSISLPKGGGALKNIDETFQVNPSNGTASFSIDLPLSPNRNDFIPSLKLSYNSGSGNGVFGLGWNCELPSIQRRTDKLLPAYRDSDEGDVFLLSGYEDLVPELFQDGTGAWLPRIYPGTNGESIRRYRPRIEASFERIEQVYPGNGATFYWKTTSKENIVTIYGRSVAARLADPADATRIFRWFPELSYDDRGNVAEYLYKKEDLENVPTRLSEQNRLNNVSPFANIHLKQVRYGNSVPYTTPTLQQAYAPLAPGDAAAYLFDVVFDFGDENIATAEARQQWPCRHEPFSNYKPGFELRTYRICRRILFFNNFKELNDGHVMAPCLVRSLDISYRLFQQTTATPQQIRNAETDYVIAIQHSGYKKSPDGSYIKKSFPPLSFSYQEMQWDKTIREVSLKDLENDPAGLSRNVVWTDLWGEGISGILAEEAHGWFYKSNLGDGHFSPAVPVVPKPSVTGLQNRSLQLLDLEADGQKFIVYYQGPAKGYFGLSDKNDWNPFRAFDALPTVDLNGPDARFIDLNGDGKADLILSGEEVFTWYASRGKGGFDEPELVGKPYDEEKGPALVFADSTESIFVADMSGDGLSDLVRIRNGEICYWPNLGYGRFGPKVNMDNVPFFDNPDQFNPASVQLTDINGTGTSDLVYLGKNSFRAWINLAGNGWGETQEMEPFPSLEQPNQVAVADFLGNGTACLVWSSPLPQYASAPIRYIDLMGGIKPHILSGYNNNFGKQTSWSYKSSTFWYLQDKLAGAPWISKLPFPVQCVASLTVNDLAAGTYLTNAYSYHHGYYDHAEREFRGFGRVEQRDTENFENFEPGPGATNVVENILHQAPVKTISWFHTGYFSQGQKILAQYEHEYQKGPFEFKLPESVLPPALTPLEYREAFRACKGMLLRQEIYADDDSAMAKLPYAVSAHNCLVRMLQPRAGRQHAVFMTHDSESITVHYERNLADPRITHSLNLEVDNAGNVKKHASVVYGRKIVDGSLPGVIQTSQVTPYVVFTQNDFTINPLHTTADFYFDDPQTYRGNLPSEISTYELTSAAYDAIFPFNINGLLADFGTSTPIAYDTLKDGTLQRRLLDDTRITYLSNDLSLPMQPGQMDTLAFVFQKYQLAFTPELVTGLFGTRVNVTMTAAAGYQQTDGINWWIPSGANQYLDSGENQALAAERFFQPVSVTDAMGGKTMLRFDPYNLLLVKTTDPLQNSHTIETMDYRVLQPILTRDANNNAGEYLFDELGMLIATALNGAESDGMHGDKPLSSYTITLPVNTAEVINNPQKFLQQATSFFYYDLFAWLNDSAPVCFANIFRQTHTSELDEGAVSKVFLHVGYSDGFGRSLQTKTQAEPGDALIWTGGALQTVHNVNPRWVGTGRTIYNNKGNPVKRYEPFFSTTYGYETEDALVEIGFSPVFYYDPLGRAIETRYPDDTFSKNLFTPWIEFAYDRNDTVKDSGWYDKRILHPDPVVATAAEIDAATKAAAHYGTPAQNHLDSLGRRIFSIADNGIGGKYGTQKITDIQNNLRELIDPRGNKVVAYSYDIASRLAYQLSMDAGQRWVFRDVLGNAAYRWDSRDQRFRLEYDQGHRQTGEWLTEGISTLPAAQLNNPVIANTAQNPLEKLVQATVYGEDKVVAGNADTILNLRGRIFQSWDPSGLTQTNEYDFSGNLKTAIKQLATAYKNITDWNVPAKNSLLDGTRIFNTAARFDATGKITEMDLPDGSKVSPVYNEANLPDRIDVFIGSQNTTTSFVQHITYNARGQRESILYGNNSSTSYTYEPTTYRLGRLLTTRNKGADILQDLNYTHDPVGNITSFTDSAIQTIFFNNARVDPGNQYEYDAIYRLVSAMGREHIGQNKPSDQFDLDKSQDDAGQRLVMPGDMAAMQRYQEVYQYDAAGNMQQLAHNAGNGPFANQWTRVFTTSATNNKLVQMQVGGITTDYNFDLHGNTENLLQGSFALGWNYADQLQQVNLDGGGIAYYVYDSQGRRVRKVVELGSMVRDRVYLGNFESYQERQAAVVTLDRQTLHVMDGNNRVALVETRIGGQDRGLGFLIRHQYANHLGSATMELTGTTNSADGTFVPQVISYEEYYPFGDTAFQFMDNQSETAKRYRYTGMERDDESGLNYHGARYYVPWLARWLNPDPFEIADGNNVYTYVGNNPVSNTDKEGTDGKPANDKTKPATKHAGKSPDAGVPSASPPNTDAGVGPAPGGGTTATQPGGAATPQAPPATPNFVATSIYIPKTIFDALQKNMDSSATGALRFKPVKSISVVKDGKKQKINVKDYGVIELDSNFSNPNKSLLWDNLKSVGNSGQQVLIQFLATPLFERRIFTLGADGKTTPSNVTGPAPARAQTYASADLTRTIFGGQMVKQGSVLSTTSVYDDTTSIYLVSNSATPVTISHELLGHFFIAARGLEYGHSDDLTGKGIVDNTGQPFKGTVLDYITTQVEPEATANFTRNQAAATAAAQQAPAPKPHTRRKH